MNKLGEIIGWIVPAGIVLFVLWYLTSISPIDIYDFFAKVNK